MSNLPSLNGSNGRQSGGQFGPGNRFGRGNPTAKQAAEFRQALLAAVSTDDVQAVVATLVTMAKAGDIHAIKEVLNRLVGRPREAEPEPLVDTGQPAAVVLLDYTLKPAKAAELLGAIESGDTSGICELLRRHAGV